MTENVKHVTHVTSFVNRCCWRELHKGNVVDVPWDIEVRARQDQAVNILPPFLNQEILLCACVNRGNVKYAFPRSPSTFKFRLIRPRYFCVPFFGTLGSKETCQVILKSVL